MFSTFAFAFVFAFSTQPVAAYTWKFDNAPSQCSSLSVSIVDGTGGNPPFNLLIIPYGPTPLFYDVEVRAVQTLAFNSSTSLNFTLNYPAGSQLVAVVSDQNGFATGGTSTVWTVQAPAADAPLCFNETQSVDQAWDFYLDPADGYIRSCESYVVEWTTGDPGITGTPNFVGVIPSGESFNITTSTPSTLQGGVNTGFNWTVPVNAGTDLILVSGDRHATGSGGSVDYKVQPPTNPSSTACFASMPSATSGTPAGGYPDGATSSTSPNSMTHKKNVGAIAGGVVGGILGLSLLLAFLLFLLRRQHKRYQIDLDDEPPAFVTTEATPFTTPTPFDPRILYSPTQGTQSERPDSLTESSVPPPSVRNSRPMSNFSSASQTRKLPLALSNASQVNIIRHVDSGRIEISEAEGEQETIELPPLYDSSFRDGNEGDGPRL